MRTHFQPSVLVILMVLGLGLGCRWLSADETKPSDKPTVVSAQPGDADQEWRKIEGDIRTVMRSARQPADVRKAAGELADRAGGFAGKHPTHEKAANARQFQVQLLAAAINAGDASREKELTGLLDSRVKDSSLPEDERVGYFMAREQLPLMRKLKDGGQTGKSFREVQAEMERGIVAAMLAARKEFPNNAKVYEQLLMLARNKDGEEGKKIAQIIATSDGAPAQVKKTAQDIVAGKKPYEIGKPLDIRFTAVDGREVDIAKLKGKVVLVDFWATWCGPCVQEIPNVKAAYEKLHPKGLEIVGISFDNDKQALVNFVEQKKMDWPQYFDGRGWGNAYGAKYGINSIPRMWLVGRDGNLADTDARGRLEEKVTKLLEAKVGDEVR